MSETETDAQITELQETGRTYITFEFGEDLAQAIPLIIERVESALDFRPTIHLSGSNVLLVAHPEAIYTVPAEDPDGEEG